MKGPSRDVPYIEKTIEKPISLWNTIIRAYDWLLDFDLIAENLGALGKSQNKIYQSQSVSLHHGQQRLDGDIFKQ